MGYLSFREGIFCNLGNSHRKKSHILDRLEDPYNFCFLPLGRGATQASRSTIGLHGYINQIDLGNL